MNDDDLVQAIANGQPDALSELYRRLRAAVYVVALAVTAEPAAAEDVLQEVFVRVQLRAGQYRPGSNARAWVLAIARNLALDASRRRQREAPREVLEGARAPDDLGAIAERHELLGAMLRLDGRDRQIVALRAIGDLKFADIAKQLQMPPGTVRSRYHSSLRRLRSDLRGGGDDAES